LRVKPKITISKGLFIIFIIALFYEISGYNISAAVNSAAASVNTVTASARRLDIIAGGATVSLKATVLPSNAANKAVTWSSSNEAVATVSTAGVVTPIAAGITVIVVKTVDGGHADSCIVNVTNRNLTGISLTQNAATLKIGNTLTLRPVITPLDASNKTVIWSSGNEVVAKVSKAGVVTAIASGTAGIIGRTVEGNYLIYCIVYIPQVVDSITLSQNSIKFNLGDAAVTLSAKVMPDNLSQNGITWASSNYSIANVDSNGKVNPVSGGNAIITATSDADKNKKSTCSVIVIGPITDTKVHAARITLNLHQKDSIAGTTFTLNQVITPSNAANKAVTWSSSNEAVATVSTAGIVTPIAAGMTVIVVKTVDGEHADICIVNVTKRDVTGISLTQNQVTLKIKSTVTLKPVILPLDASNKEVIWTSGNEAVAKVSEAGVVTAIASGAAGIIGKTVDGNYLTFCIVYIPEVVDSITLSQNSIKFNLGDPAIRLSAKIMPDNLSQKGITWTSSNYSVANVDSNGKVTPVSGGTAVITATSVHDKTKKATCNITVTGPITYIKVHAERVTLNLHQKDSIAGTTFILKQVITPSNASNKTVTWSSSNEAVATVSTTGVVTPIVAGMTVIVVKTVDGEHADICIVNVKWRELTGISLTQNQATLKIKSTLTLKPVIMPLDASNKTVIWTSGNEAVAKVSEAGVVTAIASGTAGIIGRTVEGNYLIYCIVYIPQVVDSITLSQNSIKFNLDDAAVKLLAIVKPDNLSQKGITWTSSNYGIANVDSNGKVTPVSGGNAIITATSDVDKNKKSTCSVTVIGPTTDNKVHVERITLNLHQKDSIAGTTFTLNQVITPSNAANKAVTWSSSNEAVATVSTAGIVTPIAAGMTVIVVKTMDGEYADVCIVNVTKKDVTGINLIQNQATLKIKSTLTLKPVITPLDASNKVVIWSSGNSTVAKVSDVGVVTAIAPGTAGIIGRTVDGNYLTFCIVYVPEQVDSVTISKNIIKFKLGDATITLLAKIMPENRIIKHVTWTSSNPIVAYVDSSGKVTPVSGGTTVITATSVDDTTKKATCSVTVVQPATGVIINR